MACKFKTVAFDSAGELCRLFFSKSMGKSGMDSEKIRQVNDYPAATERLNMLVRRCKDLRNQGVEIVFTAHEDIQKVYARGGAIAAKGQQPAEPISVSGQPDLPGTRTPAEFCRAADNVLRVRWQMGKPVWVGRREQLSSGSDWWEVKDRFNAPALNGGLLPPSYSELAKLASANPNANWEPAYIWLLYGPYGIGKTRSLLSFPRPMRIYDLEQGGVKSIAREIRESNGEIEVIGNINPEHSPDYDTFMASFGGLF